VNDLGRLLIVMGVVIALVGVAIVMAGRLPWLGRLPGDIHVERGNWSFHFPIMTSLLLSVILTLIFYLIGRR
jgi:Protein of unknown function (DUF2905)